MARQLPPLSSARRAKEIEMKDKKTEMTIRISASLFALLMAASLPLSADPYVLLSVGGTNCGSAGVCTSVSGATTITFDGLAGQTGAQVFGPATYTPVGTGSPFVNGSVGGEYAAPPGDSTDYLTLGSPSRPSAVDITFGTAMSYFGFYMGSPDSYNNVKFEFYLNGDRVETFSGSQLGGVANGDQSIGRYLNFNAANGNPGFTKVRMYSDAIAFETDNHAYKAVPNGGVTVMLLGGVLVGLESLRRKFRV